MELLLIDMYLLIINYFLLFIALFMVISEYEMQTETGTIHQGRLIMSTRNEPIASYVKRLKTAGGFFFILAWLVWVDFIGAVGLGLTILSDYVPHWSVFLVLLFIYACLSACLFLASWALKVIVYIFDELRLVV